MDAIQLSKLNDWYERQKSKKVIYRHCEEGVDDDEHSKCSGYGEGGDCECECHKK